MPIIEIVGLASKTSRFIEVKDSDMNENLLDWLRKNGVTIASSCAGEGVCRKCKIQNDWLTCEFTLQSFLETQPDGKVSVSYL
jgi:Na+-transporting NADH:ubiquinone oxidoreductase subunit NqrF